MANITRELFPHASNFVEFIQHNNCGTPAFVYVKTFIPAFIKLLVVQNILFWDDVVRMIAEEKASSRFRKGLRSGRHGRLNLLNNAVEERERYMQKGLRTLLIITQPLETIGYVWLLWATADQFFYDWQTLIQLQGPCSDPPAFRPFQRARGPGGNIGILPGGSATSLPILDQNSPGFANNVFSASLPAGTFHCIYSANVTGPSSGISGAKATLRITNSPSSPTVHGEATDLGPRQEGCLQVDHGFRIFPPGGSVGWEITGPAVPVGLPCASARVILTRTF